MSVLAGTAIACDARRPGAKAVEGITMTVSAMAVFDGNTGNWYIRTVAGQTLARGELRADSACAGERRL